MAVRAIVKLLAQLGQTFAHVNWEPLDLSIQCLQVGGMSLSSEIESERPLLSLVLLKY